MTSDRTASAVPASAGVAGPRRRRTARAARATALALTAGAMAVGAAAAAAMNAAAPGGTAARPPLRVCADPDNLPFSSAEGSVHGLSMDIAQLVADALGRPMEPVWVVTLFGKRALRTTLLAGQCDAFVGLPETTDLMGKRLIFSEPLFTMGYALTLPAGETVNGLAGLDGRRVGVQYGTPPQSLLATRRGVTSVTFMDAGAAMAALGRREIDAAFVWGPIAGYLNQNTLGGRFQVVPVAGEAYQWPVGIGFARTSVALRDEVDHALPGLAEPISRLARQYGLPTQPPVRFAASRGGWQGAHIILAAASADDTPQATAANPPPSDVALLHPFVFDPDWANPDVVEGRALFNSTCAHCHGPNAEQAVARINLKLLLHRYGVKMDDVFATVVTHGRPSKGMPNWSGILSESDLSKIGTFLHTVQQAE